MKMQEIGKCLRIYEKSVRYLKKISKCCKLKNYKSIILAILAVLGLKKRSTFKYTLIHSTAYVSICQSERNQKSIRLQMLSLLFITRSNKASIRDRLDFFHNVIFPKTMRGERDRHESFSRFKFL